MSLKIRSRRCGLLRKSPVAPVNRSHPNSQLFRYHSPASNFCRLTLPFNHWKIFSRQVRYQCVNIHRDRRHKACPDSSYSALRPPPLLPLSPLLPSICRLFGAQKKVNPFAISTLPPLFAKPGGLHPSSQNSSFFFRRLATRHYLLSFHAFAASWAHGKRSTPLESVLCRLFFQNLGGGIYAKSSLLGSTTSGHFFASSTTFSQNLCLFAVRTGIAQRVSDGRISPPSPILDFRLLWHSHSWLCSSIQLSTFDRRFRSRLELWTSLVFEDDGKNERPLGGLLVDVALEVDANLFFDDAPVGFFFGVRLLDGFQDDRAGAGQQFLAIVAEEAAGHDFGLRFELPGVFVDGDDRHDHAVFGEMLAVADDDILDLFERTGIHAHAPSRDGIAPLCAIVGELDALAIFEKQDFFRDSSELVGERRVAEQMPVFAMNGNEILRLDELQDQFLLFLAGVAGNVNRSAGIVVVDERPAPEHVVKHPENRFLIPRNDARGKNHAVIFVHGNEAVIVHRDPRKRRHRLSLAAARQNDQPLRVKPANVLRPHHYSVGNPQIFQRVRDLHVVDHAPANEGHLTPHALGDVDHLLNAVNRRRKARQNHAPRRRAAQLFDARHNRELRRRKSGALHVGRVAEQREHAFIAIACESMQIEGSTVHGRLINLKVPRVNNHADRCADRQRHAINGAVRDRDELDFVRPNLHEAAGENFTKCGRLEEARFFETFLDERQREARSVNRYVQIAQNVRQRADVVFVAVSQDDGAHVRAVLLQIGGVGNDEVDAEELGFREHHARVDDDDVVAETQGQHVHSEFAETAERNCCKGLLGLAQRNVISVM